MFHDPTILVYAIVAVVLLVVVWKVDLRPFAFYVRIVDGRPVVRRGKVTATFLDEIAEVCADLDVRSGWVGGVRRGPDLRLVFARSLPPAMQQRLRNAWHFSR